MTLVAATRLGPYEILSPLGSGGMGEVYRARDTRLGREVAIKVLPAALSSDPERLKRFEKEARSASALNHPNIVTIHDIGSEGGVSYIAMERVEGSTLREMLASGSIAIKKLLQIAPQIGDGLAKAHEAGIVHRDLKPENVMVTKDGLVKILDFGLAKLTSTMSGSDEASNLPTMTGTTPGVIVGTVGYMSPEQASGQLVDFRSDQFSFGSMLYEMATGKRAFQKKTAVDTLAAILNEEPEPIEKVNAQAPAPLRWIVERCLAKEPQQRYASTEDLARDLSALREHVSEAGSSGTVAIDTRTSRRRVGLPVLGAISAALGLIVAGSLADRWLVSKGAKTPIPTLHKLTSRSGNVLTARFAPDGRTVVYGAAWDGAPMEIFTVRTDSTESRAVGLTRAVPLAVSSNGELAVLLKKDSLRWGGKGTLARLPLGGGTPRELLENVWNADWAPNGEDMAIARLLPDLRTSIEYPIGKTLATGVGILGAVRVSPSGELVAFMERGSLVTSDRNGKRRVVSAGWDNVNEWVWAPKGDEIILAGTKTGGENWSIYAVSLSGKERVLVSNAFGFGCLYDIAPDGRLLLEFSVSRDAVAFQPRGENHERDLTGVEPTVDISEDGSEVLFEGGRLRRIGDAAAIRLGDGSMQGLSPDGRWAFAFTDEPSRQLVMLPTGPGDTRKIPVRGLNPNRAWLLPNGKGFLLMAFDQNVKLTLALLGPDGGTPTPLRADGYTLPGGLVVSPDGERVAFVTPAGRLRILPLSGAASTDVPVLSLEKSDYVVQWSADGRYVYLCRAGQVPAPVDRVELSTGRRDAWKKLMPSDSGGLVSTIGYVRISRDGQSYAYFYNRVLASDLYVMDGVR